jgi:superfamily II DNA/RNA helicase
VFGGQPIREQTEQLQPSHRRRTPGRVMDLIRRGWLPLQTPATSCSTADEMLARVPRRRVDLTGARRSPDSASATMPPPIRRLAASCTRRNPKVD